tara:strand:+ start:88 stop:357 length:270 start_codon:yes stop_codon:yes gene_type:complete
MNDSIFVPLGSMYQAQRARSEKPREPLMTLTEFSRNPNLMVGYAVLVKRFKKSSHAKSQLVHHKNRNKKYYVKRELEHWADLEGILIHD